MNRFDGLKQFFFYCGIERDEFLSIRHLIWQRNTRTLRITSALAVIMGASFFLINYLTHTGVLVPYAFLFVSSLAISLFIRYGHLEKRSDKLARTLCYIQMTLICIYAMILSTQASNYAIPATSVIVFIALLPQSVDDRPVRMYSFMVIESAAYLIVSHLAKSPRAFSLDIINVVTFCVVGMILYYVVCTRNVSEIYQSVNVSRIQKSIITSLATVVEERDESTGGHIMRTEDYVQKLADRMRADKQYSGIPDDFYKNVVLAAPMHDIGKIKIPDRILNKPGKLTADEFELMKKHSEYGAELIDKTMKDITDDQYRRIAYDIARSHHERYDGAGYPDGLKGEDIPLEARMMALADVYDALISERVYKKAYSKEKAVKIIREGSGTQFDPKLVPLFLRCLED